MGTPTLLEELLQNNNLLLPSHSSVVPSSGVRGLLTDVMISLIRTSFFHHMLSMPGGAPADYYFRAFFARCPLPAVSTLQLLWTNPYHKTSPHDAGCVTHAVINDHHGGQ